MKNLQRKLETVDTVLTKEEESCKIDEWLEFDGDSTPFIIIEELTELIIAIKNYSPDNQELTLNLVEEIADCQISFAFCKKRYSISGNDDVQCKDVVSNYLLKEGKIIEDVCVDELLLLIQAITKYDGRNVTFFREELENIFHRSEVLVKTLIYVLNIPEEILAKIRTLKLTQPKL